MNIGSKIRKIRKSKKMTLEELSSKSNVAIATLSRIETGRMTGTLESHMNIAQALGLDLPSLYDQVGLKTNPVEIISKNAHDNVFVHTDKSAFEMLTSRVLDKKMMPVLIKLEVNGKTNTEQTAGGIEKFIYIIEGEIEVTIADKKYTLACADSLYFEGSSSHFYRNTGKSTAKLICVTSPPAL